MSQISNLSFSVRFEAHNPNRVILTDTTPVLPTGYVGIFKVIQPDGYVREGNINTPDVNTVTRVAQIALIPDSKGQIQKGQYVIELTALAPGYLSTTFTRTFAFQYTPATIKLRNDFDLFTPKLQYTDITNYAVSDYNLTSGPTRAWNVTSPTTGTITGTAATVDLKKDDKYYAENYAIGFGVSLVYANQSLSWLTVAHNQSASETVNACVPKPLDELTQSIDALRVESNEACGGDWDKFEKASTLYSHLFSMLRLVLVDEQFQPGFYDVYQQLLSLLNNGQTFCNSIGDEILPYDFINYESSVSVGLASETEGVVITDTPVTTVGVLKINIDTASADGPGLLSDEDWMIFNAKQDYIVPGTTAQYWRGDKTWQTLDTSVVPEGTNLYFTNTRARQAVSLTTTGNSGASTYDNATGVFNIPNYTLAGLGGVPSARVLTINGLAQDLSADRTWSVGTVTSIATTGPITGGPITGTGTIGITQSGASSDGYLSSTDWNVFNSKEPYIAPGTTAQYWRGDKTWQTLNTAVVPESTNLYYTDARARLAISLTTSGNSGASTYNNTTGVLNVPNYTLAGLGGVPLTRQLTINGTTYDLSGDRTWNVGTVTGSGTLNYVVKWTPTGTAIGDSQIFDNGTNVGIGTADVSLGSGKLRVVGSVRITDAATETNALLTTVTSSLSTIETRYPNSPLVLGTNALERLRITGGGSLYFKGASNTANAEAIIENDNTSVNLYASASGSINKELRLYFNATSSGERIRIFNNGRVFVGPTPTDAGYQLDVAGTLRSTLGANFATTSGNVGVGTASPATKLHVLGASNAAIRLQTTTGIGLFQFVKDDSAVSWNIEHGRVGGGFGVYQSGGTGGGNTQLYIAEGGNVGIGTTTPGYKLHVKGPALDYTGLFFANTEYIALGQYNVSAGTMAIESGSNLAFLVGASTERMRISTTGAVRMSSLSGSGVRMVTADATGTLGTQDITGGVVLGSGTLNYVAKWTPNGTTLGISSIFDDGTYVGVGTASPSARVDIRGASTLVGVRYIENTTGNTNRIQLGAESGVGYIEATAGVGSPVLSLRVAGSERARIYATGNMFVGPTPSDSGYRLDVNGTLNVRSNYSYFGGDANTAVYAGSFSNEGRIGVGGRSSFPTAALTFYTADGTNNFERMRITSAGSVGVGTQGPSARLHVSTTFTDSAIEEAVRIQRSGLSSYNGERQIGLVFADDANFTLTSAISGLRNNPTGHYLGGITFRVSTSVSTAVTTVAGLTEVARLTSDRRLGINTVSPSTTLHVVGDGTAGPMALFGGARAGALGVKVYNETTAQSSIISMGEESGTSSTPFFIRRYGSTNASANVVEFNQTQNAAMLFYTNNIARAWITAGGNVGIGRAPVGGNLDVYDGSYGIIRATGGNGGYFDSYTAGGTRLASFGAESNGDVYAGARTSAKMYLMTNSTTRIEIASTGTITASSLAGTGTRMVVADANGVLSTQSLGSGAVTGTGTLNYVAKWTPDGTTLGDSQIFDNGTSVGVGTALPAEKLEVNGGLIGGGVLLKQNAPFITGANISTASSLAVGSTGGFYSLHSGNNIMQFNTNGSERLRIFANGRVGINTGATDSGFQFDVNGTARINSDLRVNTTAGFNTLFTNPIGGGGAGFVSLTDPTAAANRVFSIGFGSVNYPAQARIEAYSTEAWTSTNRGSYLIFRTTPTASAGVQDRMIIGNDGFVGINTLSPAARLHVAGNMRSDNDAYFATTSGSVGIGTTTTPARLTVSQVVATNSDFITLIPTTNTTGDRYGINFSNSAWGSKAAIYGINENSGNGAGALSFYTQASSLSYAERMRISSEGNVAIGITSIIAANTTLQTAGTGDQTIRFAHTDNAIGRTVTLRLTNTNASYSDAGVYIRAIQGSGIDNYSMALGTTGPNQTTASERIRINNSGNVGIGTETPYSFTNFRFLTIDGTSGSGVRLRNGGSENSEMYVTSSAMYVNTVGALPVSLGTNSAERMRIFAAGNVFIGPTPVDNGYRLDVSGNLSVRTGKIDVLANTDFAMNLNRSGTSPVAFQAFTSNAWIIMGAESSSGGSVFTGSSANAAVVGSGYNTPLQFATNNIVRMTVTNGGDVGIGLIPSGQSGFKALEIGGSGVSGLIDVYQGTSRQFRIYNSGSDSYVANITNGGGMYFRTTTSGGTQGNNLVITSTGNVGVGTTSPSYKLSVVDADPRIWINSNTGTGFAILHAQNSGGSMYLGLENSAGSALSTGAAYSLNVYHSGAYPIIFSTSSIQRMRITATGNVGVGTESPYSRFTVSGAASASTSQISIINSEGGHAIFRAGINGVTNNGISFITADVDGSNQNVRAVVSSTGNFGIGTVSPLARLENYTAIGTRPSLGDITSNYNIISGDTRTGTAQVSSSFATTLTLASNADTFAENTGASIGFHSKWNSGQYTSSAQFASIFGGKENGTDANLAGYMSFATRPAGGNPTPRMRITSDGYVLINRTTSVAADYFLQINGQTYGESTVAFKQTGNLAAYFLNTISVTNAATFNEGTAWAGVRSINDMTFNGSVTIPAGAVVGGAVNANRLSFATASNTITMTQSGNNIRAIAGFQVLNQFAGTNNGTITHGAGILVQGVDRVSGASTPTFTNYYGIAINDMNEFSEASFTNRWGVYQVGTSDRNYFAGRTLIGSNVDGGGGQILQVTGDALITGSIRTGAPTSGTSQAWKLGSVVSSSVTLSTGSYVEVEINGTFYRLAIVTPA